MVTLTLAPEPVALTKDEHGFIRVSGTRIGLELLVYAFREGRSPEDILRSYDTLALADIYSVFTYYLRHTDEVNAYMAEHERKAAQVRARTEAWCPPGGLPLGRLIDEIDEIVDIALYSHEGEYENQVRHLPL